MMFQKLILNLNLSVLQMYYANSCNNFSPAGWFLFSSLLCSIIINSYVFLLAAFFFFLYLTDYSVSAPLIYWSIIIALILCTYAIHSIFICNLFEDKKNVPNFGLEIASIFWAQINTSHSHSLFFSPFLYFVCTIIYNLNWNRQLFAVIAHRGPWAAVKPSQILYTITAKTSPNNNNQIIKMRAQTHTAHTHFITK